AAPYRAEGMDVRIDGDAATRVGIGAEALRAVLANLLENVRQHAGPGAAVRIAWERRGGGVALTFADDGRGISAGNAAKVFGRFFTTARDAGGTGLGLAIARSHLEAAGGGIALLPGQGRGARFELTMPSA
ncbi:MAG: ATP-binding protein, partial [Acetobacteraceae bacterium]|nr:ATP-binding protein [Acetobacteraceae bacterium]